MPLTDVLKQINDLRIAQQYDQARPRAEAYVRDESKDPDGYNLLGLILREVGDPAGSVAALEQAIKLESRAEYRCNLAMSLLHQGKWAAGYKMFESRFDNGVVLNLAPGVPLWNGVMRPGLRLLISQEQGQGDAMQFIRYARILANAGVRVTFWAAPSLAPLMDRCREVLGLDGVRAGALRDTPFDAQLSVMSLQQVMRMYDPVPPGLSFPYLGDPGGFPAALPDRKPDEIRIAIAWACNEKSPDYHTRSCPVQHFEPIAQRDSVRLLSLQKMHLQNADAAWLNNFGVIDARPHLHDFRCTAAGMRNTDAVVTVDTSIAHMAGAYGMPTIVMLRYGADWRWHDDADFSRWYPSVHIVKQRIPNDWPEVVHRVCDLLERPDFRPKHYGAA